MQYIHCPPHGCCRRADSARAVPATAAAAIDEPTPLEQSVAMKRSVSTARCTAAAVDEPTPLLASRAQYVIDYTVRCILR